MLVFDNWLDVRAPYIWQNEGLPLSVYSGCLFFLGDYAGGVTDKCPIIPKTPRRTCTTGFVVGFWRFFSDAIFFCLKVVVWTGWPGAIKTPGPLKFHIQVTAEKVDRGSVDFLKRSVC